MHTADGSGSWNWHGLVDPIIKASERAGASWTDAHKAELEAALEDLADGDANKLVSAIAAHINMNGVAGMMQNPIRNALTGSEPELDKIINDNIGGGIDQIEALLEQLGEEAVATGAATKPAPPAKTAR